MKFPLFTPLVALALGILASRLAGFGAAELLIVFPLFVALIALACWRSWRIRLPFVLMTVAWCGAALEFMHRPGHAPSIDASSRETVLLTGCVVSPPAFYEGRDQFVMELAPKARARVSLMVRDGETPPDLRYGQPVELEARVRPIRNFQNPGAFDYQAYSALGEIYWTSSVAAGNSVKVLPGRCGSWLMAGIFALRTGRSTASIGSMRATLTPPA